MSYGKPMKKNFYSQGAGDIEMPPLGEVPPVLADSPELFSNSEKTLPAESQEQEVYQDDDQEVDGDQSDQSEDESEQEQAPVQPQFKNKQAEQNFKNLREARQKAEWERDALKAQMLEMQRAMQNGSSAPVHKQPEPKPEVDDFDLDIADDALFEGKDAKKLIGELKKVKQQLKQWGSQSQETAIEAKIRATYPDFSAVVSEENVSRLNREYPEIAQTLRDTPDLYNKASAAYSIMKRFGIYQDRTYEEDKMKAIKNAQKPRPIASVSPQQGDSPLSKANAFANGLSKDLQKQLLAEMAAARKGL